MLARRAFLRAIGLGLPASLLLAGCKHWQNGNYPRTQGTGDGADGGGGSSGGGGSGGGGGSY